MEEDATFIHNVIVKLCNDDKEVILVIIPMVASCALKPLRDWERLNVRSKD
jgi:hypothetical protein